jgi:hypothetical protein
MKYQITYKEQEKRHDGDGQCSTVRGEVLRTFPASRYNIEEILLLVLVRI